MKLPAPKDPKWIVHTWKWVIVECRRLKPKGEKMSGSLKLGLLILGAVVAFYVLNWIVKSLITVAIIGGVVLVIAGVISSSKSLGGGRRTLP